MDRRRFLIGAAWAGLASGLALVVGRCAPAPIPSTGPTGSLPPTPRGTLGAEASPAASAPPSPFASVEPRDNRVAIENARPGNHAWAVRSGAPQAAFGFIAPTSVGPGESVTLHAASGSPLDVAWYRLGWYGGAGGRLARVDRGVVGSLVTPPVVQADTGRAEAAWPATLTFEIPDDWLSGMYVAVLQPRTGGGIGYAPFVVRAAAGAPAPVLVVHAAATWQAYNVWGGANLYDASTADSPLVSDGHRAVEVSFDRPYILDDGAGFLRRWELQFIRWQEREGRDVDYVADIDLELHPDVIAGRRLIVFPGHHEYWSRPMRTTIERAIAGGVNVAFLSANEIYWQIRLGQSDLGPGRRITCYKSAALDPLADTQPSLTTCRWREDPVTEPEAALVGQMYGHIVRRPGDWVVASADHWLYEGTGLSDGDHLVNLVGQEYDTYFADLAPAGTTILARGPVRAVMQDPLAPGDVHSPAIHTATMYAAPSGAAVFAAGTFQWSWAIDEFGDRSFRGHQTPYDDRVVRMTRNLFDRLGDGPAPVVLAGPESRSTRRS